MVTERNQIEASAKGNTFSFRKLNRKPFYFTFLILFITIFSFQNCSPSFYSLQGESYSEKTSDSGNGGGYEGKITYYRFVPDLMCGGQETYKEMLVFE